MPIYLLLNGGEQGQITGDATQDNHPQWMNITSMHWAVNRNVSTTVGAAANREASEPNLSEVTLTKISDSSHTALYQAATTGKVPMTATIDLVNTGDPGTTYCSYELKNVLVGGFTSGTSGDRPTETLSLNFTAKTVSYTPEAQDGTSNTLRAHYDQAAGKSGSGSY